MKKIALLIVCLGFIPAVFGATPDPDLPKREQEGEPLTAEMHFLLGLSAYDNGDKEEAAKQFGLSALLEKSHVAYYNWGNALLDLARMRGDEALFRESFPKFAEAIRLKPDFYEAYYNWGFALTGLARMKKDEALFREAFTKYEKAVSIKPDHAYYHNWAVALRSLAGIVKDEAEREALLKQAVEKIGKADELRAAEKK
jgi:tetratricopeptide (TPR) repeat protein